MQAIVWTKENCPACTQAKAILKSKEIPFTEMKIGETLGATREMLLEKVPTAKSLPQIFVGVEHIGGVNELRTYLS